MMLYTGLGVWLAMIINRFLMYLSIAPSPFYFHRRHLQAWRNKATSSNIAYMFDCRALHFCAASVVRQQPRCTTALHWGNTRIAHLYLMCVGLLGSFEEECRNISTHIFSKNINCRSKLINFKFIQN